MIVEKTLNGLLNSTMFFYIKKLITSLILPPGIFVIILALGGLFVIMRHRKTGYIFFVSALCLYALSIEPVKDVLLRPLEDAYRVPEKAKGDVIVVLGGGTYSGMPDLGGKVSLSGDSLERLVCCYRLWKRLQAPVIISGGRLSPRRTPEAEIAARILSDMGVAEKYIIVESKSKDTRENARYVKQIMEKNRFKSPILITSAYHLKRAVLNFSKERMDVTPFPCGYRTNRGLYHALDFLPNASSLEASAKALKEYLGIVAGQITLSRAK